MIKQENWCEKYRCNFLSEVIGQEQAIDEIKDFLKKFIYDKQAAVLHGPPGTGKTTIVHALANELELEILELNASDLRNREQLEKVLYPASLSQSLFKKGKIILVDEVDGISPSERGGIPALLELIETTEFPIIMTANNIWDSKFSQLRQKSRLISLKEINPLIIQTILRTISEKENLQIKLELLKQIAIKSRGDVRAAINDLQATLNIEIPSENLDERNKKIDIFKALQKIFKKRDKNVTEIYDEVDLSLDEIFLWIEENIPAEYSGEELYKAFDALSLADVFRGRIYRQQHWRFLVYQNLLLSAGIAFSKKEEHTGFTPYKRPSRILKIWLSNQKNEKKKSIAEKYALFCHVSKKRAKSDFFLISKILKNLNIQQQLKLEQDEVDFLNNLG